MRRVLLVSLAAGGLALVSSCSSSSAAPNPTMTFASAGGTVSAAPLQYCDLQEEHCQADGGAAAALSVNVGQTVRVSAPQEVANTPWQVAARFDSTNGSQYVACSPLFAAGRQTAYTVTPPHTGDRLVLIEVYQSSATLIQQPDGDVTTPIRGTWVLTANTQGSKTTPVLPKPGDNLCAQS